MQTQNTTTENKFIIDFMDSSNNIIYSKTKRFSDEDQASKYAHDVITSTSDECVQFNITQIN